MEIAPKQHAVIIKSSQILQEILILQGV